MNTNSSSPGIMSTSVPVVAKAPRKVASKKDAAPASSAPSLPAPAVEAPAPSSAISSIPSSSPAASKRAPAKRAPKTPAADATTSAPAPVVVSSTPVEAATIAPLAPATSLDDDLRAVSTNLTTLRETASTLLAQIKRLEKRVHREMKEARRRRRRVKTDENGIEVKRAPSIFERPTQVTQELLTFLGRPAATLMSRSEVTKAVNDYVKAHDLKNKHDIKPDAALRVLLAIGEGEPLTYFNLQRYLNRHYIKAAAPVATA